MGHYALNHHQYKTSLQINRDYYSNNYSNNSNKHKQKIQVAFNKNNREFIFIS